MAVRMGSMLATAGEGSASGEDAMNPSAKVLLIIPYFGAFGPWFPLYLYSLANQHTLTFTIQRSERPA
jgi:hypothetical protein